MRNKYRYLMMVVCLVVVSILGVSMLSAQDMDMVSDTATVHLFSDMSEVDGGWSTLTRYDGGVLMTLHTSGLNPGHVVTVWWVVFNEPSMCSDGACGENDIFIPDEAGNVIIGDTGPQMNMDQIGAAQISVLGATGNLIPESGEGHYSAWLGEGESPVAVFGPGLIDAQLAEIHLVLQDHGEMNPDLFDTQITTFHGGCDAEFPNAPCEDVQFAVHAPPA